MFERFTDRARKVIVFAQEEARLLNHNYIGTEHLLLGMVHEDEGVANQTLTSLGYTLPAMRDRVQAMIGIGTSEPQGHIPFTPRAKKCIELALREALKLGHNYVGTEHLLLGLVTEGKGVAAKVLEERHTLPDVRAGVLEVLTSFGGAQAAGGETKLGDRIRSALETTPAGSATEPSAAPVAGPCCPRCRIALEEHVAYKTIEIPGPTDDAPKAKALMVYCTTCGQTIETLLAPDEM